jgi:hypothetical protein
VFENRVLRRIFGHRRVEVVGSWRRSFITCTLLRVIKSRMRLVGHVACMGEKMSVYKLLVGKPDGRPL